MYSFAHFSDLHLAPVPRPAFSQLLGKRSLSYLSWLTKRKRLHRAVVLRAALAAVRKRGIGYLCVTGDLVNLASPAEIEQAGNWLRELAPDLGCSAVPGNHDVLVASAEPHVRSAWAPWMGGDESPAPGGGARFPYVVREGRVAFIGLSSAEPTPPGFSSGRLGAEQRGELERILRETGSDGCFRVLLLHHPPEPCAASYRRRLADGASLLQLLRAQGAELVLHGHLQAPRRAGIPGPGDTRVPVFGAGSASLDGSAGQGGHFHEFLVERTPSGWRLRVDHHHYDRDAATFQVLESETLDYPAG